MEIGLGTSDLLSTGTADTLGRGRVLVKQGNRRGSPTTGILHLSGARIRRDKRDRIGGALSELTTA